ncbi:MAG: penicillin-binding protein 2 [Firmicutes bacterium]|nr:penicillin-binding protein 2 [Bacillota bacterium]
MIKKLNLMILIIGLLCCVLVGRLAWLQLVRGDKYGKIARFNVVRKTYVAAPRGLILDRNGLVLAKDVPRLNICAVLYEIDDINVFARKLSKVIDMKPDRIIKLLKANEDNIYQKVVIKPKADMATMMKVAEIQADLPGLYLEVQPVREYPNGECLSHILGYVGEITDDELKETANKTRKQGDVIGKDGLEKFYDPYLQGRFGEKEEVVNAAGKVVGELKETQPKPGYNLYLTIDLRLQQAVEKILKTYIDSLSIICKERLAGSAILMDAKSGEVIAMASYPGFDPNMFARGISNKEYSALIKREDYPLLNRNICGGYPAASTYKMITGAAALQERICTRYSPFYCSGQYKVGNSTIWCFVKSGHGKIDFPESIAESCDTVFYFLGESLGIDRLVSYSKQFGIGQKTGIDLPGETRGLLPDPKWKQHDLKEHWYTGDTVNLSIGQGYLAVTPLQMAVATQIVANRGFAYRPHLLGKAEKCDGTLLRRFPGVVFRKAKVDPANFDAIADGMALAVKKGTAKRLKVKGLPFAAKTGTAESFPCPENPHGRNHTWVVGFGPTDNPNVVLTVFLERSGGLAGETAVSLADEIMEEYAKIYGDGPINKEPEKEENTVSASPR